MIIQLTDNLEVPTDNLEVTTMNDVLTSLNALIQTVTIQSQNYEKGFLI